MYIRSLWVSPANLRRVIEESCRKAHVTRFLEISRAGYVARLGRDGETRCNGVGLTRWIAEIRPGGGSGGIGLVG